MIETVIRVVILFTIVMFTSGNRVDRSTNVQGTKLQPCSTNPMTGWYRDGYCRTDQNDHGTHTVCATMTADFLAYTKRMGNDLSTPRMPHFPGLKPGDRWCLCASRWEEARRAQHAPDVKLDATNDVTLRYGVTMDDLNRHDDRRHSRQETGHTTNTNSDTDGYIVANMTDHKHNDL